jgi:hypothetical protein
VSTDALSPDAIAALRAEIIGKFQPVPVIAAVNKQAERTVYATLAKRPDIPTIKVGDELFIDPREYAVARTRRAESTPQPVESLPPPRRPGRPRKVQP